ncbi:MAG: hypothetical protein ACHQQP_06940, partial [Gemmatimonadales bacterium]
LRVMITVNRVDEIGAIRDLVRALVMGDAAAATDATLGKARALAGVARFPARVKCALLGWNALARGLDQSANPSHAEGTDTEG